MRETMSAPPLKFTVWLYFISPFEVDSTVKLVMLETSMEDVSDVSPPYPVVRTTSVRLLSDEALPAALVHDRLQL